MSLILDAPAPHGVAVVEFEQAEIDDVWEEAGPLFAEALKGSDDTPEQVYHLIKSGTATLLTTDSLFVVLQYVRAEGVEFDVLVWIAASRGPKDCIKTHLKALEELAFAEGARYIAFRTNRVGFTRVMPEDWCVMQAVWGKRLH